MAQQVAKFVNPVLAALKRLGSGRPPEVCDIVAQDMKLDSAVLEKTLKSGASWFENKVAWVRQYFVLDGIVDGAERGVWTLTEKGRNFRSLSNEEANRFVLEMQRRDKIRRGEKVPEVKDEQLEEEEDDSTDATPEESDYKARLLEIIRGLSSKGFEQLCRRLLLESGFERVDVKGGPGDGGIDGDGILKINPFVTLKVHFQCKKYAGTVGPSEVREFRGAMHGARIRGSF